MDQNLRKKIESILKDPTVTDERIEKVLREGARERIASWLILLVGFLYIFFLTAGSFLLYFSKITFRDLLDLILVLGALSGFLGTAIHFYFKA